VDIKEFWSERAGNADLDDVSVTHRDIWQRWLEIETIRKLVKPDHRVIDVGCGAGYCSRKLAPSVASIVGVDFAPEMIARARQANSSANASFHAHDVLELSPDDYGMFDVALSVRCLINITDRDKQYAALENIASVLKPGGLLIFLEGSQHGRAGLNGLRAAAGLDAMPTVWHNVDFREEDLLGFLRQHFEVVERISFGVYDLVARVIHPLLVQPEAPSYEASINEIGASLALNRPHDLADISRVVGLVLRKK
jgi:ubiquinone/menaquinone biosynthesis C-methylase UbiE